MSLENTPAAERVHIGFFGMRNAGKSSLVNAVTNQAVSLVSDIKGTTTDPVRKTMELLPLGPVVIIDTPGFDDSGTLGEMRIRAAENILSSIHIAVLVIDGTLGMQEEDAAFLERLKARNIPYVVVKNKADLAGTDASGTGMIAVSAKTGLGIEALKKRLGELIPELKNERHIVSDLLQPGDLCVLVAPIDESAPKGRLILPQQETLREILDAHCLAAVCQPAELPALLRRLNAAPKIVITDSQAFAEVEKNTPADILLTSFSILFARYKGELEPLVRGAKALESLRDGDRVLISEGCTHHRQCMDIGTVKIPNWIAAFTGAKPDFRFTSGREFPETLDGYKVVIHCGGCMLSDPEMRARIRKAEECGVPIVNYGIAIAHMHGILKRCLSPFPALQSVI